MKKLAFLLAMLILVSSFTACESLPAPKDEPTQCYHNNTTPATCTTPEECLDCGEILGAALGHSWDAATCMRAKSCSTCSIHEGSPVEHNYVNGWCEWCHQKDPSYVDIMENDILPISQINMDVNSAGGVEVDIKFTNKSSKQIAYIYFTLKFYDRMGSPAYCEIKNTHTRRLQFTGPVNAGKSDTGYWDPIIYCSTTAAVKPLSVDIEYTDGTKQTLNNTGRYWYESDYYGGNLRD